MKHILVPIGSTESAQSTLQYAIDFAAANNAKIFVFRAYNAQSKAGTMVNVSNIIARETNLYLKTMVKACNTNNVDIKLIAAKGGVIDSIQNIDAELGIDLVIVGAKSNAIKEELFLGNTAGSIVKKSDVTVLAIPDGYIYKPVTTILMATKSGAIRSKTALKPLQYVVEKYKAKLNVLLVKTPNYTDEDLVLHQDLEVMKSTLTVTENATTFQGVLEHFKTHNPDMLCVLRRKRGFFKKLWEKNTILKEEFYTNVPLLVLRGK